ncbi:hypothetical protein [Flavobacterium qiangtangense]
MAISAIVALSISQKTCAVFEVVGAATSVKLTVTANLVALSHPFATDPA